MIQFLCGDAVSSFELKWVITEDWKETWSQEYGPNSIAYPQGT